MLRPQKRLGRQTVEEDKLVTYTNKAQKYAESYWRIAAIAVGVVIVVLVAINFYNASNMENNSLAALETLKARDAFARAEYDEALTLTKTVISDFSGTSEAASAMMLQGRIHQQRADYEKAELVFNDVIQKHGDQNYLAFGAYNGLGAIYYGKKQYAQAADYYKEAAVKYPDHFNAAVALVDAGEAYEEISKYQDAKKMYKMVLQKYPKSRSANTARTNLSELEFME